MSLYYVHMRCFITAMQICTIAFFRMWNITAQNVEGYLAPIAVYDYLC